MFKDMVHFKNKIWHLAFIYLLYLRNNPSVYYLYLYVLSFNWRLYLSFFILIIFLYIIYSILQYINLLDNIYYIGGDPSGGGEPSGGMPGGSPGGPGNDGSVVAVAGASGIPHSDTNQSLVSNVSYTSEDLRYSGGAELLNVKNILQDKILTPEQKETEVLKAFTRLTNELIEAKRQISQLKQKGDIPMILDINKK